jgi:thioredoxin-related protein
MKNVLALIFCIAALSFTTWQPDFQKAKLQAKQQHQLILLNFSGSDWCGPCIRMKKEIFGTEGFSSFADHNLVLVNADFPRSKKHQLSKQQQKQNDVLAEKYNPSGKFPLTVLLDEEGKVLKSWDGLPDEDATAFTNSIKKLMDARR